MSLIYPTLADRCGQMTVMTGYPLYEWQKQFIHIAKHQLQAIYKLYKTYNQEGTPDFFLKYRWKK